MIDLGATPRVLGDEILRIVQMLRCSPNARVVESQRSGTRIRLPNEVTHRSGPAVAHVPGRSDAYDQRRTEAL